MKTCTWGLSCLLVSLLSGCTVTRWIEDGAPGPDSDSGATVETGDSGGPGCRLPVPDHVTLESAVFGSNHVQFYVPTAGWALATLHASRQLERLESEQIDLRLSPAWFFAVALETSFMGCSDGTPADPDDPTWTYPRQPGSDADGCMGLSDSLHIYDLCRLYPDDLACTETTHETAISSTLQGVTGRDNVEPSVLASAWYAMFSYAMIQWASGANEADPDGWFAVAADPYAVEKILALGHRESAYSSLVALSVQECQDQAIEACWADAAPTRADLAQGVASHVAVMTQGLGEGHCYDPDLTVDEVTDYVDAISVLFPDKDASAAATAGAEALREAVDGAEVAPFQAVADGVLEAIDNALPLGLRCPGSELSNAFTVDCPP